MSCSGALHPWIYIEARHLSSPPAVGDGEEAVALALLATMEEHCGVNFEVTIYVACPPHDLWLLFSTDEKCTAVLQTSMKIKCDRRWMKFERWVREVRGTSAALPYKCKLSFEDLPDLHGRLSR
ncbi:hypothetical protein ZWY2020_059267 [Hordeum vulgare]|nr:hypothetical protein ZWY2020_059267 [Hordeum vulgare]